MTDNRDEWRTPDVIVGETAYFYKMNSPADPTIDHPRPCPVNYGPLDRALGWLTLAAWGAFLVLAVLVPLTLWWWG